MPDFKIIVVDGDQVARELLYNDLINAGYHHIKLFGSLEDVLRLLKLRKNSVDLIITEMKYSKTHKLEVIDLLYSIRKRKLYRPNSQKLVKVLILSTYANEENVSVCLAAGADDFMSKPYQVLYLLDTVKTLLSES